MSNRLPLLDSLRGLALVGMIVFHAAYDLSQYEKMAIDIFSPGWTVFARSVAVLFLLISGMAMELSEEKLRDAHVSHRFRRRLRRASITMAAALIVTAATWIADPETYVRFGILHFVAVARLLVPLAMQLPTAMLGVLAVAIGVTGLTQPWFGPSFLLPLGVMPHGFTTVDYFPLVPWMAPVLIGVYMMRANAVRTLLQHRMSDNAIARGLAFLGRHSLITYLVHQPVLLAVFRIGFGA